MCISITFNYVFQWYSHMKKIVDCFFPAVHTPQKHGYNLTNDVLYLTYDMHGCEHKICVSRSKSHMDIHKIYNNIKDNVSSTTIVEYPIVTAILNDKTDITDRINMHLGHQGCHVNLGGPVKIKWILNEEETKKFCKLQYITTAFEEFTAKTIEDNMVL